MGQLSERRKQLLLMVIDNTPGLPTIVHFPLEHCPYRDKLYKWLIENKITGPRLYAVWKECDERPLVFLEWIATKSGLLKDGKIIVGRDIIYPKAINPKTM